jgi:hypothetical protein
MKVLALIYGDEASWESASDEQREAAMAQYRAFGEAANGKILDGAELAPTRAATTVRVRNGETIVTDGPFAETKEILGGVFLIDLPDLDEAIRLASLIPAAKDTGSIEIRPILQ